MRAKKAFLVGCFLMSQCRKGGEEDTGEEEKEGRGKDKSQKQRSPKEKWNGIHLAGTNARGLPPVLISSHCLSFPCSGQTGRKLSGQDGKMGDFREFLLFLLPLSSPHLTSWHTLFLSMFEWNFTHSSILASLYFQPVYRSVSRRLNLLLVTFIQPKSNFLR